MGVLQDGPAHGYAIIAALRERSGGEFDLAEGTIYPALHRLEESGRDHAVRSRWPTAGAGAPTRSPRRGGARSPTQRTRVVRLRRIRRRRGGYGMSAADRGLPGRAVPAAAHRSAQRAAAAGRGRRPPARRCRRVRGRRAWTASMPSARRCGGSAPSAAAGARRPAAHASAGCSLDTGRAVTLLGGIGLLAIGVSGLLAGAMGALFGRRFRRRRVWRSVFGGARASVAETAHDAMALRVLAGLVGAVVLGLAALARAVGARLRVLPVELRRHRRAGRLRVRRDRARRALSIGQLVQHHGDGTGFFLSGALVSLVGAVAFGVRAVRAVLTCPPCQS